MARYYLTSDRMSVHEKARLGLCEANWRQRFHMINNQISVNLGEDATISRLLEAM